MRILGEISKRGLCFHRIDAGNRVMVVEIEAEPHHVQQLLRCWRNTIDVISSEEIPCPNPLK